MVRLRGTVGLPTLHVAVAQARRGEREALAAYGRDQAAGRDDDPSDIFKARYVVDQARDRLAWAEGRAHAALCGDTRRRLGRLRLRALDGRAVRLRAATALPSLHVLATRANRRYEPAQSLWRACPDGARDALQAARHRSRRRWEGAVRTGGVLNDRLIDALISWQGREARWYEVEDYGDGLIVVHEAGFCGPNARFDADEQWLREGQGGRFPWPVEERDGWSYGDNPDERRAVRDAVAWNTALLRQCEPRRRAAQASWQARSEREDATTGDPDRVPSYLQELGAWLRRVVTPWARRPRQAWGEEKR